MGRVSRERETTTDGRENAFFFFFNTTRIRVLIKHELKIVVVSNSASRLRERVYK